LHLIGPMRGNETGHWEPARLVALHDEMLAEAGSRWDDWRRFDTSRLLSDRVAHYKTAIKCLIKEEYGESPLLVLKDPRVCRFVGLYKEILPELGIAPAFILPLRNPLSILASLATRDDLSPTYASLVWLRHVLDAEAYTRGQTRVITRYEDLLDDWRGVVSTIADVIGRDWPRKADEAAVEIEAHLSPRHQHHSHSPADLQNENSVGTAVAETYRAFLLLKEGNGAIRELATLDRVRAELDDGSSMFSEATFTEMAIRQKRHTADVEHLQRLAAQGQDEVSALATQVSAIEQELSTTHDTKRAMAETAAQLTTERDQLATANRAMAETTAQLTTEMGQLAAAIRAIAETAAQLIRERDQLAAANRAMAETTAQLTTERDQLAAANRGMAETVAELTTERDQLAAANRAMAETTAQLATEMGQLAAANRAMAETAAHRAACADPAASRSRARARCRGSGSSAPSYRRPADPARDAEPGRRAAPRS